MWVTIEKPNHNFGPTMCQDIHAQARDAWKLGRKEFVLAMVRHATELFVFIYVVW